MLPNLNGIITLADISQKKAGAYAADYVNWAKVAHLLHEHAPGWMFHLQPTKDGNHVWQAPDNTTYVVGYFTGPDNVRTPDFPQSIMDNRNNAIKYEAVTARDLTDAHRRCLCTAAAFTFGLAWQLWAKEAIEDPHRAATGKEILIEAIKINEWSKAQVKEAAEALGVDPNKATPEQAESVIASVLATIAKPQGLKTKSAVLPN